MRFLKIRNILLIIASFFILYSCEYEKREEIDLGDLPEVMSFQEHIIPIFETKCTKCHDGGTAPNLTADYAFSDLSGGNYLNTDDPEGSKLYQKINGGSMTQYADDLQRAYILKWIEQGAEDN